MSQVGKQQQKQKQFLLTSLFSELVLTAPAFWSLARSSVPHPRCHLTVLLTTQDSGFLLVWRHCSELGTGADSHGRLAELLWPFSLAMGWTPACSLHKRHRSVTSLWVLLNSRKRMETKPKEVEEGGVKYLSVKLSAISKHSKSKNTVKSPNHFSQLKF